MSQRDLISGAFNLARIAGKAHQHGSKRPTIRLSLQIILKDISAVKGVVLIQYTARFISGRPNYGHSEGFPGVTGVGDDLSVTLLAYAKGNKQS